MERREKGLRQRWEGRREGQGLPFEIAEREGPEEGAVFRERGGVGFWAWDWDERRFGVLSGFFF